MFCDCCMVQLLYVQPYTHEVVDWTLWRGGFAWFMVVSTRRVMLVFAMVLVVVCDTDLRVFNYPAIVGNYRKADSQTVDLKPHGARRCPART